MYLLPSVKKHIKDTYFQLLQKVKSLFASKRSRYKLAVILDLILIATILINAKTPAQNVVSPLVSSVKAYYSVSQNRATKENFAFVPGLARNKYSDVDLMGLTNLSFFDVPLTEEGTINRDSRGYASFTSGPALELFDRARYQKTKIFVTLSATGVKTIANILDNKDIQEQLAQDAAEEINNSGVSGITLDFEYPRGKGKEYQEKFTSFIETFTNKVHDLSPEAQVAVAVPSARINNDSLYNIENLAAFADRIFLIASDLIVPEAKNGVPANPLYGYMGNEYWNDVSKLLGDLHKRVPQNKLVMERAWYGNGDNYPLYLPSRDKPADKDEKAPSVALDGETMENLLAGVPAKGKAGARKNIPLIAQALQDEGILDSNVLAYALATIEHETDETFEPIAEIQGNLSARRLGYEGGANYFGRGFIQITHLRNYHRFGDRIGMGDQLVKNPDLASDPQVAAKILAAFFKDNNVANLASRGNFVAARIPINPDINAYSVASLAEKYGIY